MLKLCHLYLLGSLALCISGMQICPDSNECPDGSTCCLMLSGEYGCCPLPKAVCCSDKKHCCPNGFKCDVTTLSCFLQGKKRVEMVRKQPAIKILRLPTPMAVNSSQSKVGNVICPDKYSECTSGTTCCLLTTGQYGCCPYPNAICCNDHLHCCPQNYKCSLPYCVPSAPKLQEEEQPMKRLKYDKLETWFFVHLFDLCPGGKSTCSLAKKCCPSRSGRGGGCCQYKHGVCCPDGLHCCPKDFICSAGRQICVKKVNPIPIGYQIKAKSIQQNLKDMLVEKHKSEVINCAGGNSSCTDEETCCEMKHGEYGCCPEPAAVCCEDRIHCCPYRSKCDVVESRCLLENGEKKELQHIHSPQTHTIDRVTCSDNEHECPLNSSCCQSKFGVYKCCPVKDSICCGGNGHCCPIGSECHGEYCVKGLKWFKPANLIAASKYESTKMLQGVRLCPDNTTKCDDNKTCCNIVGHKYMCCPFANAVCCKNSNHCCPKGYKCGAPGSGICNKSPETDVEKYGDIDNVCPDGLSRCPINNTCCKLKGGVYGCCPLPKAVCCPDLTHCCPGGYKCANEGYCTKGNKTIVAFKHNPAISISRMILCPDRVTECFEGNTCCMLASHQYGCCPLVNAVCCSDHQHCCPFGYQCSDSGFCIRGNEKISSSIITKSFSKISLVACPDGISQCPAGFTCCKLSTNQYGCCPLPKAVCCNDHKHCCPHGYLCKIGGLCTKGNKHILASKHTKAIKKVSNVICPDGVSQCPDGNTCCKLWDSRYGCCPLPDAVCCSDEEHCCPYGYSCQSGGYCTKGNDEIPAYKHTTATKVMNVICSDGISQCPNGYTCCKLWGNQYGCCPLPEAVCCSDKEHCCPNGYSCQSGGFCTKGENQISASKHIKAVKKVFNVICPDAISECPAGSTCCKLSDFQYGCCPLPEAVCCSDNEHCCPQEYACQSGGFCTKGENRIAASKHIKAVKKVFNVICPDGVSGCPDGSTCCKLSDYQYGCCPLPEAVCCSDKEHCCPQGYTCQSGGFCTMGKNQILASKHTKAIKKVLNVICPDGVSQCPDGSTCCKLSGNQYGCCPLPEAVCCSDEKHCCPQGYTCQSGGFCTKGENQILAFKHIKAVKKVLNVICPDGVSQCSDGSTCCKLSDNRYGCCPFPEAVCCSDKEHCCPPGFTCQSGLCHRGMETIAASKSYKLALLPTISKSKRFKHRFLKSGNFELFRISVEKSRLLNSRDKFLLNILQNKLITCADGMKQCKQYETCCPSSQGYVCCPLYNAVCCGDQCCPNGSQCSKGFCKRSKPASNEALKFTGSNTPDENIKVKVIL